MRSFGGKILTEESFDWFKCNSSVFHFIVRSVAFLGGNFNNNIENDDGDQLSLKKGREAKPCHDFPSDFLSFRDKTMKIKDLL